MKLTLSLLLFSASLLFAGGQIAYQGIFLDKNGAGLALNDTLQFKLFSGSASSSILWQETHFVQAKTGVFTVNLGSKTALVKSLFNNDSLFLEVSKGAVIGPRIKMGMNAFAMRSFQADTAVFAARSRRADTAVVCSTVIYIPVTDSVRKSLLADSSRVAASAPRATLADTAKKAGYADSARTIANAPRATLADSAIAASRAKSAVTADTSRAAGTAKAADSARVAGVTPKATLADSATGAVRAMVADSARTAGDSYWKKNNSIYFTKNHVSVGIDSTFGDNFAVQGNMTIFDSNRLNRFQVLTQGTVGPQIYFSGDEGTGRIRLSSGALHFDTWIGGGVCGENTDAVVISANCGTALLKVKGSVNASAFVAGVTTLSVPDFVFAPNYKLLSLEALEDSVKTNRHLPNIPSADSINKSGLDLANINLKLLQKVEEMTLYIIQQNKKITALESRLDAVEKH